MFVKNHHKLNFFSRFLTSVLLLSFLSLSLPAITERKSSNEKTPRKRALLIGISKYDRPGKPNSWWNLNTELDTQLLSEVLISKFNFAKEDIVILQNEKATRANILAAMKNITAQTQKGDIVFIHFSGHGNTIPDDKDDELDKKDESLIPYDYASKIDPSNDIRDDVIGQNLDELKKKEPANVTVSFDSCYSGTATRGNFPVRGGANIDYEKSENESPSGLNEKNQPLPKDYVFLSATNPRQPAFETQYKDDKRKGGMGAYTFALVKALSETTSRTTYRDLNERINDYIKTGNFNQSPQIEGSLDEIVFDGTAVKQERFVSVSPLDKEVKTAKAILQIGQLQGATVKSRYAIFSAGTKDPKDKDAVKIAEGEIVEIEGLRSLIKLDKTIDSEQLRTARAFEIQHYYADSQLKVALQNVQAVKGGDKVVAEFKKMPARGGNEDQTAFDLAEFTETNPDEITRGTVYDIKIYPAGKKEVADKIVAKDFRGLIMERKDGSIMEKMSENEDLVDKIKIGLERENRLRIVKGLTDKSDSQLDVSLKVVLANVTFNSFGDVKDYQIKSEVPRNVGGQAEVKLEDFVLLEIENKGMVGAYYTILNITANGIINPAFPHPRIKDKNNYIKAGDKIIIKTPFKITPPFGEESFRLIATVEQTDFSPLIDPAIIEQANGSRGSDPLSFLLQDLRNTTRGTQNNAFTSPLGRILLAATIGKRAGDPINVPPSWAVSSFTYNVKEK